MFVVVKNGSYLMYKNAILVFVTKDAAVSYYESKYNLQVGDIHLVELVTNGVCV